MVPEFDHSISLQDSMNRVKGTFKGGLVAFGLLSLWKTQPWLVVMITAIGSVLFA